MAAFVGLTGIKDLCILRRRQRITGGGEPLSSGPLADPSPCARVVGMPQSVESSASSVFRSQVRALRVGFVWIPVRYRAPASCARFLARFIGGLEGLG